MLTFTTNTTIQEVLKEWENGGTVWSVEMGGLGPGYEQCIQTIIFETCKDHINDDVEKLKRYQNSADLPPDLRKEWERWNDSTVHRLEKVGNYGFSGAQVSTAKVVAWQFLVYGYGNMMQIAREKCPDRMIQVSKNFPTFKEQKEE